MYWYSKELYRLPGEYTTLRALPPPRPKFPRRKSGWRAKVGQSSPQTRRNEAVGREPGGGRGQRRGEVDDTVGVQQAKSLDLELVPCQ